VSKNSFIITGRGGLPISSSEQLHDTNTIAGWVTRKPKPEGSQSRTIEQLPPQIPKDSTPKPIVEATGWVVDSRGKVHLVASNPSPATYIPPKSSFCPD
jgi:large exoprotein involved in heme utilization and adhesion